VLQRLPEVAAALLLYFVCIPQQPVHQEIAKQLRSAAKPRQVCGWPEFLHVAAVTVFVLA
jgi:siroheme synthase (precorrin-2 oxidase/ferrochelatase)